MSRLIEYLREFKSFQRNARLYLISNALSGITLGIVLVLYNLYLVALGYEADFVGLILLIGTIGAGVAIFPAGLTIDRFGGKNILIWSSAVIGVAGVGQFLFHEPISLTISTFIAGVGAAFVLVVNAPFLTVNSTPAERPHLFSLNIVLILATSVAGQVLGGFLPVWLGSLPWLIDGLPPWLDWLLVADAKARSYQLSLLVAGLVAIPSFIPLFMMHDDRPARVSFVGRRFIEPGGGAAGEPTHRRGNVFHATPRPPRLDESSPYEGKGTIAGIRRSMQTNLMRLRKVRPKEVLNSPVFVLVIVDGLRALGAGLFIPYLSLYVVNQLGASTALFGLIDGSANALQALLALSAPWLAQRIGKVYAIIVTRLAGVPLLLAIGLIGYLPLVAVLYPLRQGLMGMAAGLFQVFTMEAVSEQRRGLANSLYQVAGQVPWAISAFLGGIIISNLGYTPIFLIAAGLYLLMLIIFWARFGRTTKRDQPHEQEPTA